MARAIWSGAISFGLVNVPVKAYTASRDHSVHFHQLEKGTGARIRYEKVSDKTGKEVDTDDIELGYELSSGRYVTVDPDEIDALRPRTTRTIDIMDFVALDDIDPIYYERTYWLGPDGESAERPYRLLLEAMEQQRRVGIGTVVIRRKQYLAAMRPLDGALAMSTMRFADEIVDKESIDTIPSRRSKVDTKELQLATQIVDSLTSEWDPTRYKDTYTDEVRDLIERRSKGEQVTVQEAPADTSNVIDLMQALEASVAAAKQARGGNVARQLAKKAEELADQAEQAEGDAGADDEDATESSSRGGSDKGAGTAKKHAKKAAAKRSTKTSARKKAPAKKAGASKRTSKKATGTRAAKATGKRASRSAA